MNEQKKKPIILDLFCGAGGMSKGFQMAGFDTILGIDNIQTFCDTFKKNGHNVLCEDIRKIDPIVIKKLLNENKLDVIVGGPPCQGFSMAGKRDENDPRNSLFMDFIRIVNDLKPKFFVMENVPGILTMKTSNGSLVKDIILSEYKKIGYTVEVKKLLAADYGVPQKRNRVFFIGTNTNKKIFFPAPTHFKGSYIPVSSILTPKNKVNKKYFHSQKMIDGFNRRKIANQTTGNGFGAQYLKFDEPSYTISARYWKDGADALVKYSDNEIRMLTTKEVAAIQTFPKNYKWCGTNKDIYMQIGNAVPCLLAKAIAKEIKKQL